MRMNHGIAANAEIFKLAPGDMDHVFRRSGLAGNSLSPFCYNAEQAAVNNPSEGFKTLADNVSFSKISKRLLEPDIKILFHSGGSAAVDEQYYAFLSSDDSSVLAQFTNSQGEFVNLYFADRETYLQWWASIYSTEGTEQYAQLFAGQEDMETLVCALHCIDIYRRAYMESMLDYRTMVDTAISTQDYVQILKKTLASADLRWILPSLFELTPGLKKASISLKPEHLKKIEECSLVKSKNPSMLTMDQLAITMGTEFLMTWMGSVGWQASALINGEERTLSRGFLAATAFANHLFSFFTEDGSIYRFSHQPSSRVELIKTLQEWLNGLHQANPNILPEQTVLSGKQAKFCGQCGEEIHMGDKFCASCGTRV